MGQAHVNFLSDIVFPIVNFVGFSGVLYYFLRKPVKDLFYSRSQVLEKNILDARKALDQARMNFEDANKRLESIDMKKEELFKKSKEETESFKKRATADLKSLIELIKAENEQKISEEIEKAKRYLQLIAAKKIIEATEELLRKNVTIKQHQKLEEDFLEDPLTHILDMRKGDHESKERTTIRPGSH